MRGLVASSLFAALAAAAPRPYEVLPVGTTTIVQTLYSTSTAAPTPIALVPIPHPDVDQDDLENLKATKDATLRYAESLDDVDQEVATISSMDIENPLVQLEHTSFIRDMSCTANSATIAFGNQQAYRTAANDWKTHDQFVIVSYDPRCGVNFDSSKRDFMLARSITADDSTMTITADVTFVEYDEAFGDSALVTCDVGRYHATTQRRSWYDPSSWGFSKDGSTELTWSSYPSGEIANGLNWGPAYDLYSDETHTLACVGCGTDGDLTLSGSFEWSVGDGVKKAQVGFEGHMKATLAIGIQASVSIPIPIANLSIATIPLSPLNIGEFVVLGPQINIDANAKVILTAAGGAVVGATLDWPAMKATADYATSSATSEGLAPNVIPKTQFDGSLSATLDLSVPVAIGVGVTIRKGFGDPLFERTLSLVDTPGIQVTGELSNVDQCEGVAVDSGLYNKVGVDVFGLTNIALTEWSTELFSTCIATGGSDPSTTDTPVVSTTDAPVSSSTDVSSIPDVITSVILSTGPIVTSIPISTGPVVTSIPTVTGPITTGTGGGLIPTLPSVISAPFVNSTVTQAPPSYPTLALEDFGLES